MWLIEEGQENLSLKDYDHNVYRQLLHYVKLWEKEEKIVKNKSQAISRIKKQIKKYGVSDQKIQLKDVEKREQKEKNKKKQSRQKERKKT